MPEEKTIAYKEAVRLGIARAMRQDDDVFLFGLDVDDHLGIQGTTLGLAEEFGAQRCFGTPLSEDAMTGVAIGAAMAGMRPIHTHIRMDFLLLCMNQLVNIAAKAHYMFGGQVAVPMVARGIIGKSWGQGAQHSQGLHSLFMHVPGLRVVAPATPHDAMACMLTAVAENNPVIFVEHRLLYNRQGPVDVEAAPSVLGKGRICREGKDVTIVGISNMLHDALKAGALLQQAGISAEVIDPIWLAPLDVDLIVRSAEKTGRLIVADTAWTACGASAEIVAAVAERVPGVKVARIGFAPTPCPTTPSLEKEFYPDAVTVCETAMRLVAPGALAPPFTALAERMQQDPVFKGPF
ncbi:alpha-ketoacid dehydrogenase subunit beta [Hwanghaeella sp.]|uniref:alpha-ketoacid dehydrogenase subunit beta n=1 Tax=Hwanghaeella sp. TaxID=2605943 RepID=UPI003CCBEF58